MATTQDIRKTSQEHEVRVAEGAIAGGEKMASPQKPMTEAAVKPMIEAAKQAGAAAQPMTEMAERESEKLAESGLRMAELCREAASRSMADMQAFATACAIMSQGMQRMQQASLEAMGRSLSSWQERPQAMLRAQDIGQLAELQRGLVQDWLGFMMQTGTTQWQIAGETAQNALRPLLERTGTRQ